MTWAGPRGSSNMLRVFKPTSPMSVGSWLLAGYGPAAGAAAVCDVTGLLPAGRPAATLGAGLLGPAIATYTAALICDTAVPAWHEGYREMPYRLRRLGGQRGGRPRPARHPPGGRRPGPRPGRARCRGGAHRQGQLLARLGDLAEPYRAGTTGHDPPRGRGPDRRRPGYLSSLRLRSDTPPPPASRRQRHAARAGRPLQARWLLARAVPPACYPGGGSENRSSAATSGPASRGSDGICRTDPALSDDSLGQLIDDIRG